MLLFVCGVHRVHLYQPYPPPPPHKTPKIISCPFNFLQLKLPQGQAYTDSFVSGPTVQYPWVLLLKAVGETRDRWIEAWIEGEASASTSLFFVIHVRSSKLTRPFKFRTNSGSISPSSFLKANSKRSIDFKDYMVHMVAHRHPSATPQQHTYIQLNPWCTDENKAWCFTLWTTPSPPCRLSVSILPPIGLYNVLTSPCLGLSTVLTNHPLPRPPRVGIQIPLSPANLYLPYLSLYSTHSTFSHKLRPISFHVSPG
jgi:hypothetical protein